MKTLNAFKSWRTLHWKEKSELQILESKKSIQDELFKIPNDAWHLHEKLAVINYFRINFCLEFRLFAVPNWFPFIFHQLCSVRDHLTSSVGRSNLERPNLTLLKNGNSIGIRHFHRGRFEILGSRHTTNCLKTFQWSTTDHEDLHRKGLPTDSW